MTTPATNAQFMIAEGSDQYAHGSFEYPSGVVVRATGALSHSAGLEFEDLEVIRGAIRTLDGKAASRVRFRPRHTGGSIYDGGSIALYADVDGVMRNVGWFGLVPTPG